MNMVSLPDSSCYELKYLCTLCPDNTYFDCNDKTEIPDGLEIIGKGLEQKLTGNARISMERIVLSSLLRLSVGYVFLSALLVIVVQSSDVLGLFFNVLSLEFVENIDEIIFGLSKRGEATLIRSESHPHLRAQRF